MTAVFDDVETDQKMRLLGEAFLKISADARVQAEVSGIRQYGERYREISLAGDEDESELAFLNLYCELHRAGSEYSDLERELLDGKRGYFNHPGGISPLVKAESFISKDSIVADLGAGNGLQGLLFQYLYPHRITLQIELSIEMVRIGRIFQQALAIPEEKVVWINDDIMNIGLDDIDFLYLYRPSKPIKEGKELYRTLSRKLCSRKKSLVIFSIADCLKDYLDSGYSSFYTDGHLTCFEKRVG